MLIAMNVIGKIKVIKKTLLLLKLVQVYKPTVLVRVYEKVV